MAKTIKTFLLPYLAPLLYYSRYVQLKKAIHSCFKNSYDVYCFFPAYHVGGAECVRTKAIRTFYYVKKVAEYMYKLVGSLVLGLYYALKGNPAQSWRLIEF